MDSNCKLSGECIGERKPPVFFPSWKFFQSIGFVKAIPTIFYGIGTKVRYLFPLIPERIWDWMGLRIWVLLPCLGHQIHFSAF